MKNIIFVAPPAAGKGTQSQIISERYNIPHISTGSILRNEIATGSDLGHQIQKEIDLGNLVSDTLIIELLLKRLRNNDCINGYILDGFPRTVNQAILYDKILEDSKSQIDYVFYLNLPIEEAYKRIVGRLTCSNCQTVYNYMYDGTKPKVEGICDKCNGLLVKRDDDTKEVFEKRFQVYKTETVPLIEYYKKQNKLYEIDSSISKEHTFEQIINILDNGDKND
ncbi:MAG: adenylate kinase [Bacilli bacterium]|nr:adenylate kinase [Bacilli bacterium]MDD4547452.1 adenylate kinase [Bacilli bacterium]